MRVTNLSIANFRSFNEKQTVRLAPTHLALIGSNNAGKSSVMVAMDWLLGGTAPYTLAQRVEIDDYFDPSKSIQIEATLGDVTDKDKPSLMALATNKQQRGALAKHQNPEITLTLSIPPLQGEESSGRAELSVAMWGFKVHKGQTDIRRSLIQMVRVESQRRPKDDLSASHWTPYGRLMKSVLESSQEYGDINSLLSEINRKVQEAFGAQKAALLEDAQVVSYVEDVDFQLTRENNPAELLRNLNIIVTESGRKIPLERLGAGTQSAVIIGMLELVLRGKGGHTKAFAIEEPEAFVHPHGIRVLAELIRKIGRETRSQIVLSTHSPTLLATLGPADIARLEKRDGRTLVFQSEGTLADAAFARFLNQDNAEMFFADRVVLVEGATERFLLPPLGPLIPAGNGRLDFNRLRLSVVELEGKTSVINFLRMLDEFQIDRRAILDADFLSDPTCQRLVNYLRGKGSEIDDTTATTLAADLRKAGIVVLPKGEIEDYIPISDVSLLTGQTESDIQAAIANASKTSDAFKKVFATTKPLYARELARHYVEIATVPTELQDLIVEVAS